MQNPLVWPDTEDKTGEQLREHLNDLGVALSTCLFGASDPVSSPDAFNVQAGMLWINPAVSSAVLLKVRNNTNTAWIDVMQWNGVGTDVAFPPVLQAVITSLLAKAGGTMTGKIVLDGDPTLALHAATKQYVDGVSRPAPVRWTLYGAAAVANGVFHSLIEQNCTWVGMRMHGLTAPTGADLRVAGVHNEGANSRQLTITAGGTSASTTFVSPVTLVAGARLALNVEQVGSSVAGGDPLMVALVFAP